MRSVEQNTAPFAIFNNNSHLLHGAADNYHLFAKLFRIQLKKK